MGPVIMCHVYKSSQKWGQRLFKKTKNFAGTKNKKKNLQEPKLKRGIFARTNAIFKPKKIGISYKIKLTVNIII